MSDSGTVMKQESMKLTLKGEKSVSGEVYVSQHKMVEKSLTTFVPCLNVHFVYVIQHVPHHRPHN